MSTRTVGREGRGQLTNTEASTSSNSAMHTPHPQVSTHITQHRARRTQHTTACTPHPQHSTHAHRTSIDTQHTRSTAQHKHAHTRARGWREGVGVHPGGGDEEAVECWHNGSTFRCVKCQHQRPHRFPRVCESPPHTHKPEFRRNAAKTAQARAPFA